MMQLMLKLSRRMHFTHGRLWKVMGSTVLNQVANSSLKNVKYSLFNPFFSFDNMSFIRESEVTCAQISLVMLI